MNSPILQVKNLEKKFPVYGTLGKFAGPKSYVHAVKDVSFNLYEGETFGLVGESGSGKTTTGRSIIGLTKANGGEVLYKGTNLLNLNPSGFREFRKDIQLVFQDPFSSLNPRKRVGKILEEPLIIHKFGTQGQIQNKVFQILDIVGLLPEHYFRYPHEFSGGQRQRIGLARALIMNPKIIICDEPVSALDVSIQAQILNLLTTLQKELKLTLMFITHDISVVRHISDRTGIMYLGSIVEEAKTDEVFSDPKHPYTRALFSAIPHISKNNLKNRTLLKGEIPAMTEAFKGCPFHTRCPEAAVKCSKEAPVRREIQPGHYVCCHFAG